MKRCANAIFQKVKTTVWLCVLTFLWRTGSVEVGWGATAGEAYKMGPSGEWLIKNWTTEEGLPGSDVTAIVQTPDGYLWLGTFQGLVRFDGHQFRVFNRANTPDLPSSSVINLHLDQKAVLWISTDRGIATLEGSRWKVYGPKEGWTGNYVRSFAEGAGQFFVTSFDGRIFEYRTNRFAELPEPPGQHGGGYVGHVDDQGRFWVVQYRYFGYWDGGFGRWSPTIQTVLSDNPDIMAGSARDGGIWIYHHGRLENFHSGESVRRLETPQPLDNPWSLTEDREGSVWFASYNRGLAHFAPNLTMEFLSATNGLPSSAIRCVYQDSEGNRWIGTGGGGLVRLRVRPVYSSSTEMGLPTASIRSVAFGKTNDAYLGMYGGGVLAVDASTLAPVRTVLGSPALIDSVLVDRSGRLWAAQAGVGLLSWDHGKVSTNDLLSPPERQTLALAEDSAGRLWVSDHKRVLILEDGKWRLPAMDAEVDLKDVRVFAEDPITQRMWLGTDRGALYQCEQGRVRRIVPAGDGPKGAIVALLAEPDGTLWIGSEGSGLGRLRQGRLVWIDHGRGLPTIEIGSILDDGLGRFWLGSNHGIIGVSRSDLDAVADGRLGQVHSRILDREDGMPVSDCSMFTQPNAGKDPLGRLWFATRKGVAVVNPKLFRADPNPPRVRIERVEYADSRGKTHRLEQPFAEELVLPAGTRQLQIYYTALLFSAPEKVRFRHRLEGVDQDWIEANQNRSVTFNDPGVGAFRFCVTAANADGVWNETGVVLGYTVLPTFWQTRWFGILLAALIAGEGALIFRLARLRLRSKRLETELRDDQERWDLASAAAKLGLWTWDVLADQFWATENAYAVLGSSPATPLTLQRLGEIVHPDDREAAERAFSRALSGESEYETEFRVVQPNGESRWLAARGVVDRDRNGKPVRLLGVWIDLTVRKHLEFEAARQRAELVHMGRVMVMSELSGSLAHEINQPLTAIVANAQAGRRFLKQNPTPAADIQEILDDIVEQGRRAGEVIRRMRSMLRKGAAEFQPLDANQVIQQVIGLMRSDLISRHVPLRTRLTPRLPLVLGDPVQIQQVLLNLMLNACEAMQTCAPVERELILETELDNPSQVRISVRDRGLGVSGSMLEGMFEPFMTTKKSGLGMGLALCRSIIEAHGGRIWAARNEGQGITVSFTIKATPEGKT